jgi:histidinol phosphatase-like PHP family hydrolase
VKGKQIYEALDLAFIVPELREHTGEIKAAEQDRLPRLIRLQDIQGDLHVHTTETDGLAGIEEMVQTAQDMGVKIAVSSDAHDTGSLSYLRMGIDQARRGRLEPADVINTSNCHDLLRLMTRK